MNWRVITGAAWLAAGCYAPSVPADVACGDDGACPIGQRCIVGVCRSAAVDDGGVVADADDGVDAPSDAFVTVGAFSMPVLVPMVSSSADDFSPSVTADGLALFLNSDRDGAHALYVARRVSTTAAFDPPSRIVELDGNGLEYDAEVDRTGTELIYVREIGIQETVARSVRSIATGPWSAPTTVTGFGNVIGPSLAVNDLRLLLDDDGVDEYARSNLAAPWVFVRSHPSLGNHGYPAASADGLEVFTARNKGIYRSTRASIDEVFGMPVRISWGNPFDNNELTDPELSADGTTLYLSVRAGGNHSIYAATR